MLESSLFINENLPDECNGLWALVHCDSWCVIGELEWIPQAVLKKAINVNIVGTVRLTQIMLPLIRQVNGRVVFLSSALAKISSPVRGIQSAVQASIESLAICLRSELKARKVDVSVVAAGEFTAGTAWLDDENLLDQVNNSINHFMLIFYRQNLFLRPNKCGNNYLYHKKKLTMKNTLKLQFVLWKNTQKPVLI